MKFRRIIFILIIIFQFLSCASSPKQNKTILNGIIYNADNEPVSGAKIYIDQEQQCISDIYGHFYISGLKLNHSYNLSIIKEEYEKADITFDYLNESQVIYVKITSFQQLLNYAEKEIKRKNYSKAEEYLSRANTIYENNYSFLYLKAINHYSKSEFEPAITILENLLENKKEPYVYLLLADCYQYGLNDLETAKKYLKLFLDTEFSQKIKQRYDSL